MGSWVTALALPDRHLNGPDHHPPVLPVADVTNFEPKVAPKHDARRSGVDEKILSLYARDTTLREVQTHLEEVYEAGVSTSSPRLWIAESVVVLLGQKILASCCGGDLRVGCSPCLTLFIWHEDFVATIATRDTSMTYSYVTEKKWSALTPGL